MEKEEKAKESQEDELHQQFKHLQQDWDSFKESNLRCLHPSSPDEKSTVNFLQLLDNSPRQLISSLQHKQSALEDVWNVRNNDLAIEEILRERRAAIESGKLKGRRLFEDLESASQMELRSGKEEICSGCSSVLIQGSEVRSLCSYSSSGDDDGGGGGGAGFDECVGGYCYSSSSTSSVFVEKMEKEMVVVGGVEEKRVFVAGNGWGDGGKWMVGMGWLAIVLMAFAMAIILLRSFDGYGDEGCETLIPT